MGIVESRHGQGTFLVNHIDQRLGSMFSLLLFMKECSVKEVHQLRRSIETSAYLLAVKQVQSTQIQELCACLDALKNSSTENRATLDKQFHDTLVQFSENRMFILLMIPYPNCMNARFRNSRHICHPGTGRSFYPVMQILLTACSGVRRLPAFMLSQHITRLSRCLLHKFNNI